MSDLGKSVADAVNAAFSESPAASSPAADDAAPPPSKEDAPPSSSDAPASGGERARDEAGKFAKTDKKPAVGESKAAQPETAAGTQLQAKSASPPASSPPPPQHWKGSAKINWQRLPPEVQKSISDDYAESGKASSELTSLRSAIGDSRAQELTAQFGSIENGLKSILAGSDMATKRPREFIAWLAQRAGINLAEFAGGSPGQTQQPQSGAGVTPDIHPQFAQELTQLRNQVQGFLQQQQTAQTDQLQSQIQAFASDAAHPYFNDVRSEMGALMNAGRAKTMQEAYDMAVWAHPEVRKSLLDDQRKRDAEEAQVKAEAARRAAGSLTGSPAGATVPQGKSNRQSLRETVAESVAAAGFR